MITNNLKDPVIISQIGKGHKKCKKKKTKLRGQIQKEDK